MPPAIDLVKGWISLDPHHTFPEKAEADCYREPKSRRKKGVLLPRVPAANGEEKELLISMVPIVLLSRC